MTWRILHSTDFAREHSVLLGAGFGSPATVTGCDGPVLTPGAVVTISSTDLQTDEAVAWTWRVVDAVNIPASLFQ